MWTSVLSFIFDLDLGPDFVEAALVDVPVEGLDVVWPLVARRRTILVLAFARSGSEPSGDGPMFKVFWLRNTLPWLRVWVSVNRVES